MSRIYDPEKLARFPVKDLEERVRNISRRIELRSNVVMDEGRDLNPDEVTELHRERDSLAAHQEALEIREYANEHPNIERRMSAGDSLADSVSSHRQISERARQLGAAFEQASRRPDPRGHSPLLVSETHLRSHADAIANGSVFGAEERLEVEHRATVTVATDMGSPGAWGAGNIREPVTLRAFAGIPNSPLTGATAQMPSVTLPAGAAGVAEGANHTEFDTVDVANLTTLRYGRWTEVTSFVDAFDDLLIINRAHSVGIARDLNLLDASAIITAAGSVTAFSAGALDQNVRAAILKVAAAALVDPEDVVLFGSSAALAVVNGYAPANGGDRGSTTTRVYGAKVYVHEPTTAGNVYAFAPAGFQVFSDRLRSGSTIDPSNGKNKFGQWLHSTGPGVAIVGAAAGVDVVSP